MKVIGKECWGVGRVIELKGDEIVRKMFEGVGVYDGMDKEEKGVWGDE